MSDDRERAENAQRIAALLAEGVPFERIFPTVKRPARPDPAQGIPEGRARFSAAYGPSREGMPLRYYFLECQHASSSLMLAKTEEDDGEVLAHMLDQSRYRVAQTGGMCLCDPVGWGRA